jgi:hypothetical protein
MTKVADILLKINKYKETELLCEHKKLVNTIAALAKSISQLEQDLEKEISTKVYSVIVDLYRYIEKAKEKILEYSEEKKALENEELLLLNKIKENLSEGKKYEHFKKTQLQKSLSLSTILKNKEENEHSNAKHTFDKEARQ